MDPSGKPVGQGSKPQEPITGAAQGAAASPTFRINDARGRHADFAKELLAVYQKYLVGQTSLVMQRVIRTAPGNDSWQIDFFDRDAAAPGRK